MEEDKATGEVIEKARNVSDNRMHSAFKNYLHRTNQHRFLLKGIYLCGSTINPIGQGTALQTNGSDSRFTNLIRCHSAWACPHCTARVMAMKGTDIACALDALATWYHQKAFMVTFTIPHYAYMSCAESFAVLKETWRRFTRQGNRKGRTAYYTLKLSVGEKNTRGGRAKKDGRKGDVVTYVKGNDPYGAFREDLFITHNIRVYEFTYSRENGWHPHLHVLFWVPKENWNKVMAYEDKLVARWWICLEQALVKVWHEQFMKNKPIELLRELAKNYCADWKKAPITGHKAVYFSRNKDGTLKQTKSSHYISGWGGEAETSAEINKKSANGHYTPFQILENAMSDKEHSDVWFGLYAEYAKATRSSRRVEFSSRSGITKIIDKWKQTEKYIETFQKKSIQKAQEFKTVYWFSKEQWFNISVSDERTNVIESLLILARAPDPVQSIELYLDLLHIPKTGANKLAQYCA